MGGRTAPAIISSPEIATQEETHGRRSEARKIATSPPHGARRAFNRSRLSTSRTRSSQRAAHRRHGHRHNGWRPPWGHRGSPEPDADRTSPHHYHRRAWAVP